MIRILITDDHELLCQGLAQLLAVEKDFEVAGIARDGVEAFAQLRQRPFDIIILDLSMPGRHGAELIKQIKAEFPRLPILVFSMHKEEQYALSALKAGASGYLTKDGAFEELVSAIRKVLAGEIYMSAPIAQALAVDLLKPPARSGLNQLSERELNILIMIARGLSLVAIATELHLSPKTVSTYKARIVKKLGVANNSELVRFALENNLVSDRRSM